MRWIGLTILKNKLREYVRMARGETALIADRNRVAAQTVPPQPGRKLLSDDELIAKGVREGWLTPAKNPGIGPPPRKPVMSFEELMKDLEEDRADRTLR